ncbi:Hypothetical predicted protein, partial [Olea europaea subsp. europaea]
QSPKSTNYTVARNHHDRRHQHTNNIQINHIESRSNKKIRFDSNHTRPQPTAATRNGKSAAVVSLEMWHTLTHDFFTKRVA